MQKWIHFNSEQRKMLASFFNSIAVGWFSVAFVVPSVDQKINLLISMRYIVSMIGALTISLLILKEDL